MNGLWWYGKYFFNILVLYHFISTEPAILKSYVLLIMGVKHLGKY